MPTIKQTKLKPGAHQPDRPEGFNNNPWLGFGENNPKCGDQVGGIVLLEWVITFKGNPYNGKWGRNIITWKPSYRDEQGNTAIKYSGDTPVRDDTDLYNDYVVKNKVYIYDAPGAIMGFFNSSKLFEIWAESSDGKTRISKWYYVDPQSGEFFVVKEPTLVRLKPLWLRILEVAGSAGHPGQMGGFTGSKPYDPKYEP